jgi:hypothetical protein
MFQWKHAAQAIQRCVVGESATWRNAQLGEPVSRSGCCGGRLLAARIIHGFQGSFTPLLKHLLKKSDASQQSNVSDMSCRLF